jgi:uncharacterized MAPEG superfamily protein
MPFDPEMAALAASVVLLILQVFLQAMTATADLGLDWNASPRDDSRTPRSVLAGRAERALKNLLETYPAFVALALALVVTGQSGQLGAAGAWLWLSARVIYVLLYLIGVPYVRSVVWLGSVFGLAIMFFSLVF